MACGYWKDRNRPARALVDFEFGQILTVIVDAAPRDLVVGMAHDDRSEGGFPCAVEAHDGMDFTGLDGQVNAPKDFCLFHNGVEAFDVKQSAGHVSWSKPGLMKRMVSADPLRPRVLR